MQLLDLFPNSDTLQVSYQKLIDNFNTLLSNSSGSARPSSDLQPGQLFYNTDNNTWENYNGATWDVLDAGTLGGKSTAEYTASIVGAALADCNNIALAPAYYYCTSATTANIPTSVDGMLLVMDFPTNKQQQYITNNATSSVYTRRYNGTSWDAWVINWNASNDGEGSGLNADTLDSIDSTSFVRSDATDVKTSGHLTFNDNIYARFGTGDDVAMFFNGSNQYMDLNAGNYYIRDAATTRFTFTRTTGDFTATGNIFGANISGSGTVTGSNLSGTNTGDETKARIDALNVDAGTLDGVNSTSFVRSDVADIKTAGDLTFNDSIKLSLGTGSDTDLYHDGVNQYTDLSVGDYLIRDGATTRLTLSRATGDLTTTGNITAYSDERVKENIQVIPNALDKVKQISGYTFDRTDVDTPRQTGVIAQEILKVLPEAVQEAEGKLSVAYGNMIGLLIESIKELELKIQKLENK